MFRKLFIAAIMAVTGLFVLNRTGLSSYTATAWHNLKGSFKNEIPLEFEIQRLRHQVDALVPDMKRHLTTVAEDMVAIQTLRDDITETRVALDRQKQNILTMTKDLEGGTQTIMYGGREYSRSRVKEKLDRDFASFQQAESGLKSKEQLLEAKDKALEANRERLAAIKQQKQELEVLVAQAESEVKTLRLAQAQSKLSIDDSALSQCKATLAEIRNRLKVERTALDLHGQFANDAIPVEKKARSDKELTKEIRAYFLEGANGTESAKK